MATFFVQVKKAVGFTTIEMFIYVVSLIIVVGAVSGILVWMVRASSEIQIRNELATSLDQALTIMANEIRESESVYTPTTSSAQLSLETLKNLASGEPSTYVDFFLCDAQLCLKRESQTPQPLTPERIEIQSIAFIHVQTGTASSIHIDITAVDGNATHEARTTVALRQ